METNIVITISPQIPYLEKFWVLSYSPNYCQPIKLMNVIDEVYFWLPDKHRSLLQVDTIILGVCVCVCVCVCVIRHAQSTQNNFVISPEKKKGDEVGFLRTDKHKSFLQVDSITLSEHSQACPKYPKEQVCYFSAVSEERSK